MKKIISIILVLVILFSISCLGEIENPWIVEYEKDDFGDIIEDSYYFTQAYNHVNYEGYAWEHIYFNIRYYPNKDELVILTNDIFLNADYNFEMNNNIMHYEWIYHCDYKIKFSDNETFEGNALFVTEDIEYKFENTEFIIGNKESNEYKAFEKLFKIGGKIIIKDSLNGNRIFDISKMEFIF